MNQIEQYLRPSTLQEAYEALQRKNSAVLGGMLWLRLGSRRISTAIDLSDLGLTRIEDDGECWRMGAYTSLRALEMDEKLNDWSGGLFAKALAPIVGVQFRNMATVGGSVFGRFGFSDVITALLAMDATVVLYKTGEVKLEQFCRMGQVRDILTHVRIPKAPLLLSYQAQRNSATDIPVLNVCAARREDEWAITVGARPLQAVLYRISADNCADAQTIADRVADETVFAANTRASEEYRRHLCGVLVRRAVEEIMRKTEENTVWKSL